MMLYQPLGPGPHPYLRCTCRGVFLPKEGTPTSPIPSQSTHRTRARPVEERTGGAEHIPTGFLRLASLCTVGGASSEKVFSFLLRHFNLQTSRRVCSSCNGAGMGKLVTRTKSQRLEVTGRPCPDRPLLASTFLDYHRVKGGGCVEDDQDRNRRKPCLHCSCAACGCRGNGQTEGQSKRN